MVNVKVNNRVRTRHDWNKITDVNLSITNLEQVYDPYWSAGVASF